ncbi:MAG: M15 family metallopeptidase [Myxococcales bacterium]|nr:M15 family metallopeptidase [Myxococcales bacterium]
MSRIPTAPRRWPAPLPLAPLGTHAGASVRAVLGRSPAPQGSPGSPGSLALAGLPIWLAWPISLAWLGLPISLAWPILLVVACAPSAAPAPAGALTAPAPPAATGEETRPAPPQGEPPRQEVAAQLAPPAPPAPPAAPAGPPPRDDDFVDVSALIQDAVMELRYATPGNFTKRTLYPVARCLLRRAVAQRLARVAAQLREHGHRLLLWDCYRPASIQLALWELVPDPRYVARPSFAPDGTPTGGSRHSRGAAVDLALAQTDGTPAPTPTDHDDFSAAAQPRRAHRAAHGGAEARLLAATMISEGFVPIASEWWHFDAPDSSRYGFSDAPLTACAPPDDCPPPAAP